MDRRSTKSLQRDYAIPMQDPEAFSLQYKKDTSKDPRKKLTKKESKSKAVDYTDHTGLLKIDEAKPMKGLLKTKKAMEGAKLGIGGMGQMQHKAASGTNKHKQPADKVKRSTGLYKKEARKFNRPPLPH